MSNPTFYDRCRAAAILESTTIPKLTEEMNTPQFVCESNTVYQILNGQRSNQYVIEWFTKRLKLDEPRSF